jgi:hypothetical protein
MVLSLFRAHNKPERSADRAQAGDRNIPSLVQQLNHYLDEPWNLKSPR